MGAIRGIIRKGQVIMPQPADLPDETEVEIVPVGLAGPADDEGTMGPDEIARTLAAMDEIEPFEMTDEERATIEAAVAEGFAFVAMARALLREPDLPNRMQAGSTASSLCIHCNKCMPTIYSGTRCVLVAGRPGST